jgi:hypothetical protein
MLESKHMHSASMYDMIDNINEPTLKAQNTAAYEELAKARANYLAE